METLEVVYISDYKYFVGMLSSLYSVLKNTDSVDKLHFNLCVPDTDRKLFDEKIQPIVDEYPEMKYDVVELNENMVGDELKETLCYLSGNHLLSIGNYSRLLLGQMFDYERCVYIDSDTIVHCDLYKKLGSVNMKNKLICAYRSDTKFRTIFMPHVHSRVNDLVGRKYNLDDKIFYTGTFMLNCKLWGKNKVLDEFHRVMKIHNSIKNGLYRCFTMAIMNIALYGMSQRLDQHIKITHDLGWKLDYTDDLLSSSDIVDWSGIYKPWFDDGLYRNYWLKYNVSYPELAFGNVKKVERTNVETYNKEKKVEDDKSNILVLNDVEFDMKKILLRFIDFSGKTLMSHSADEHYGAKFMKELDEDKYLDLNIGGEDVSVRFRKNLNKNNYEKNSLTVHEDDIEEVREIINRINKRTLIRVKGISNEKKTLN